MTTKINSIQVAADQLLALVQRERAFAAQGIQHEVSNQPPAYATTSAAPPGVSAGEHAATVQQLQQAQLEIQRLKKFVSHLINTLRASGIFLTDSKAPAVMLGAPWSSLINTGQAGQGSMIQIPALNLYEALRANLEATASATAFEPNRTDTAQLTGTNSFGETKSDAAVAVEYTAQRYPQTTLVPAQFPQSINANQSVPRPLSHNEASQILDSEMGTAI